MTSWTETLARAKEMVLDEGDLERFRASREKRIAKAPHWTALKVLPNEATRILLALGAEILRDYLAPIAHIVEPAILNYLGFQQHGHEISSRLLDFTDTINDFESVGVPLSAGLLASLRPYLVRVKTSRDSNAPLAHWNRALTALVLDDPRTWKPIAGILSDAPVPFRAKATFEFNVQALIAHLGGALAHGAGVADVEPAWRDFLRCAPMLSETLQVDENTCLWVARVVHHHIGGNPLDTVGDFLHREVHAAAARE